MRRERHELLGVPEGHREFAKPARLYHRAERVSQSKLPDPLFDRDLPSGYGADPYEISGGNGFTRRPLQARAVQAPPQHHVRVEQEFHCFVPVKAASTSAGSGASKSAAMRIRPFEPPGRRRAVPFTGTAGGAAYDSATQRLYIPELGVDNSGPLVHVFQVQ